MRRKDNDAEKRAALELWADKAVRPRHTHLSDPGVCVARSGDGLECAPSGSFSNLLSESAGKGRDAMKRCARALAPEFPEFREFARGISNDTAEEPNEDGSYRYCDGRGAFPASPDDEHDNSASRPIEHAPKAKPCDHGFCPSSRFFSSFSSR